MRPLVPPKETCSYAKRRSAVDQLQLLIRHDANWVGDEKPGTAKGAGRPFANFSRRGESAGVRGALSCMPQLELRQRRASPRLEVHLVHPGRIGSFIGVTVDLVAN